MKLGSYHILRDSREKDGEGWYWPAEDKQPGKIQIVGTKTACLDSADYTLEGFEDTVRIERKAGFAEMFGNMIPKDHKDRFEREMERLRGIPHKYIIIETNVSKDVLSLGVPQMGFKGPPISAITKWLFELQMQYGIVPIFAGDCGKKFARQIFENIVRKYAPKN